jgi:hypothetical protein
MSGFQLVALRSDLRLFLTLLARAAEREADFWRKGWVVNTIENTHVYSVLAIKATVSITAF